MATLDSKIPEGPLETKWSGYKASVPLVNPANKRSLEIIVVGSGLAGSAAAASLAEMGYKVKVFCFQDSARYRSTRSGPPRSRAIESGLASPIRFWELPIERCLV